MNEDRTEGEQEMFDREDTAEESVVEEPVVEPVAEEVAEEPKPAKKREEPKYEAKVSDDAVAIDVPLDIDDEPEWETLRAAAATAEVLTGTLARKIEKVARGARVVPTVQRSKLNLLEKKLSVKVAFDKPLPSEAKADVERAVKR
jgi:hypothetical protein